MDKVLSTKNSLSPFAWCRLPNSDEIYRFESCGTDKPSTHPYFVVKPWGSDDVVYYSVSKKEGETSLSVEETGSSFKEYAGTFSEFVNLFHQNKLKKAILSKIKTVELNGDFDLTEVFQNLNKIRKDSFNYTLLHPSHGCWVGASPEILLEHRNGILKTVSLAGTQPVSDAPYTWGDKEIDEQELVSQHIRATLNKLGTEEFAESSPETIEAGNVAHIKTTFTFPIGQLTLDTILSELHPTPAIAGLPVGKSIEVINQYENHDRGLYTGYVGLVRDDENADFYVNLRCMQIHQNTASIYVGGGITQGSVLQAEWDETEAKAQAMFQLLKHN